MRSGKPTRWDAFKSAEALLGTPFHPQGRAPGHGLDCIGVVVAVAQALGVARYDSTAYDVFKDGRRLLDELGRALEPIDLEAAEVGDVLVFWVRRRGLPAHVAVKAPGEAIIHSCLTARRVVQVVMDERWRGRLMAAFRFPGLEE